jgi:hypothetical protein
MQLKYKLKSKEEVPAELAAAYVERDGAFILDVEGAVEKSRFDEFRNSNLTLQNQVRELNQKFEGIDADKARGLLQKQQELEDANLVKSGDVEKLIEKRLSGIQGQLGAERDRASKLEAKLADIQINQAALAAATKRGLRATAVPDLLNRARGAFKIVEGTAVAVDGEQIRLGKDGITPVTFDEWIDQLAVDASHLFESNTGGGASSNASGGAALTHGTKNPWKQETWNFTEQSRIARDNPALAAQLKRAAGK